MSSRSFKVDVTIVGILGVMAIAAGIAGLTALLNLYLPIECNFDWCVPKV